MKTSRRHRKTEHVDTEGSWAISYADMITLLVSFFVLFFTVDHKRNSALQMQESLKIRLEESGANTGRHPASQSDLRLGTESGMGLDARILAKAGAEIHQFGEQLHIEFKEVSFFRLGHTDVSSDGKKVLAAFAEKFVPFAGQYDLAVHAFTDSRPVRSKSLRYTDNLELSALRGVSAMRVLQTSGIPLRDMRIAGAGEFRLPAEIKINETTFELTKTSEDPLRFARKVVLVIEPKRAERN